MTDAIEMIYEGRGFSGRIDLRPWLAAAHADDVASLMDMRLGIPFEDAPAGLQDAYRDLAGPESHAEPDTLLFRDQDNLLVALRAAHPQLWEAASGSTLRCDDTIDMFGETP